MRALILLLCAVGVLGCGVEDEVGAEAGDEAGANALGGTPEGVGEAALAAPPLPDPGPDQGLASDPTGEAPLLGPTYTEAPLLPHGGGGGGFTGHVTPPAVIYAVRVSSGLYVDSMAFAWYQPSGWDNLYRAGDWWGSTPSFGGGGGGNNGWWYCPAGQGVIGIRGGSGALVDRIGVICGSVTYPDPYSPYVTYSPLWGGGGGGYFDDRCTAGRLVDSFNVRSGALIDNLQAICINAH